MPNNEINWNAPSTTALEDIKAFAEMSKEPESWQRQPDTVIVSSKAYQARMDRDQCGCGGYWFAGLGTFWCSDCSANIQG